MYFLISYSILELTLIMSTIVFNLIVIKLIRKNSKKLTLFDKILLFHCIADLSVGLIDIPIANKYYRLKQYQRQLEKTRNVKTALKILEQAAKDIGGQFTNRQEITGKDGGPVQTVNSEIPVPMEDYLKARREVLDEY